MRRIVSCADGQLGQRYSNGHDFIQRSGRVTSASCNSIQVETERRTFFYIMTHGGKVEIWGTNTAWDPPLSSMEYSASGYLFYYENGSNRNDINNKCNVQAPRAQP